MTSFFEGSLTSSSRSYSIFTSENSDFEYVGLPQFTIESMYYHCKRNKKEIEKSGISSNVKVFLTSNLDSLDSFKSHFLNNIQNKYYYKFNLSSKKYEKTDYNDSISDLIDRYTNLKTRENFGDTEIANAVFDIQNSADHCLQLDLSITTSISGINIPIKLKLHFKDSTDYLTGERVMANRASNIIAGVPRRETGAKFSPKSSDDKSSTIGQYFNPAENGENNSKNMVSAPLKMVFNKSLGTWESGTQQILAKLITNVDKANIKNVAISIIDNATGKDFYNPTSANYMGGFTTGLAVPLSVEEGNPYLFGPNICICGGEERIEKIRVVNRSLKSFKSGAIVLCSQIGNEWIIQDFGSDPDNLSSETIVGDWSFTKLMVNSDNYFKDARYILGEIIVPDSKPPVSYQIKYSKNISPDTYETKSRNRFYSDLRALSGGDVDGVNKITSSGELDLEDFGINLQDLARKNIFIDIAISDISVTGNIIVPSEYDIQPSKNYFVSTIFDQLGPWMFGNSEKNFIRKTNIATDNSTTTTDIAGQYYPFFWGPVFVDGFNANDVDRVKKYKDEYAEGGSVIALGNDKYFSNVNLANTNIDIFKNDDESSAFNKDLNSRKLFDDLDANAKELPAEVGILSSLNPIIDITNFIATYDNITNFIESCSGVLRNNENRFINLTLFTTSGDVYNMTPISPNKIQFSPLQAEFAAHADAFSRLAIKPSNFDRDFYTSTRSLLDNAYKIIPNWFGKMFSRYKGLNISTDFSDFPDCNAYDQSILLNPTQFELPLPFLNVPYDCYIRLTPTSKPVGSPLLFYDPKSTYSGGNLVGVIAAKNTFRKNNGGKITIDLDQQFGLPQAASIAGGQFDVQSLVGYFFGGSQTPFKQVSNPQWGSDNNDSYDSFGTTAMHVRIFDHWPKESMIYDSRYFAILHFNHGELLSKPDSDIVGVEHSELEKKYKDQYLKWNDPTNEQNYRKLNPSSFNYLRYVDRVSYNTDFRVPTYAWPLENDIPDEDALGNKIIKPSNEPTIDNTLIKVGTKINMNGGENQTPIRPENEWRVNTICRGQMLTKGGFRYEKNVIGLSKDNNIIYDAGLGFVDDQIVTLSKGVVLKIKSSQGTKLTSFEFHRDENNNELRGEGFLPNDFSRTEVITDPKTGLVKEYKGYFITITPSNPGLQSKPARIYFPEGQVYSINKQIFGPQERCPITRLSSSSNGGANEIKEVKTTELTVEANDSGLYDAFYHFHNDITHTHMYSYTNTVGRYQYVTMTIS